MNTVCCCTKQTSLYKEAAAMALVIAVLGVYTRTESTISLFINASDRFAAPFRNMAQKRSRRRGGKGTLAKRVVIHRLWIDCAKY